MGTYEPTSRRPIADRFRRTAGVAVRAAVRWHIHPDTISYGSIVASLAAGVCFWLSGNWPGLLLIAPLLCYLRLWLNMLDGMVAVAAGKASLRGEILNDLPDRVSDVLIFAGVAHSGWCSPFSGYWAAIFALLTAYVGMFGQAVGARRRFGGIMSKPWRMVTLHAGAWILRGDAFDSASVAATSPRPTIAIVSGLYELFSDNELVLRSLRGVADALEPDGLLIYTNQPWHPQVEFIARSLINREGEPWIMRRRTQGEMDALVRSAGFEKLSQEIDPWGIFTVSMARRAASQS